MEKPITDYKVDYVKLSNCIRESMIQGRSIDFEFNYDKLDDLIEPYGLISIPNKIRSKRIGPEDIVGLAEFFKEDRLAWLDHYKFYSTVVFARKDIIGALDEEFWDLYNSMKKVAIDNPDIDKAETLAKILAKYPCYVATVVSYKSGDIRRSGFLNSMIICKANTVTIKLDNYKYNAADMQ